jgi:hypothetical protein
LPSAAARSREDQELASTCRKLLHQAGGGHC